MVFDYNPYRDPKNWALYEWAKKTSTAKSRRDKIGMSNTERLRVSSGILTDHPNLQPGEISDYFFDRYYYQFAVRGPGSYHFTARIPIVGNEAYIELIRGKR